MTGFLIGAALLIATALLFVLRPLLRKRPDEVGEVPRGELNLSVLRDQLRELEADLADGAIEQHAYESARRELERRVAEEVQPQAVPTRTGTEKRWTPWVVAVALPALAISLYMYLGTPAGLDPAQTVAASSENSHELTPQQIEGMVARLAERLKNEPDNVDGWNMLARSYNALGRFDEASKAFGHLVTLVPNDANLFADYADVLAMASNKSLQGEPEKLIERALSIEPNNVKALALSGSAAFERRDYAAAVTRWQKILALVPAESDIGRSISGSISEAQGLMGITPAPAKAEPSAKAVAAGGATLEGVVELDPALRAQASDSDTVFIFARAAQGPRFPLAVLRKQVKDLPAAFVLDDSMSMTPDAKLSNFPMVVVSARISKTGNATPSAGDLEGAIEPVQPGTKNLKIRINKRNG
ncbi:c-type cytochrome biogenesis protein CcmI [Noviherbaspirillum sp. UKPF54]|uniref:c-type cytochrome biogenesis protein CcmI n=1 Tax=Noviherbaspirillum sp. UKPF54 TaxID=2601898 RepID=UPI0011B1C3A7|nr:c-type cytochrome biogenesis protein CcmI [Noviherbaspirillum sp. UKPF54]QDZ27696.1 c-type cytochrome biogenesis protein CcmI [Noviherbaspirillum sp. UKPF54]